MLEGGHTLCYRCVVCGNLFFKRAISPSRSRSRACSWASSLSSALTRRFQCAFLLAKNRTVFLSLLTAVLASRHCVFQASRLLAKNRRAFFADSYSVYLGRLLWPPRSTSRRGFWEKVSWATPTRDAYMNWAIAAHISPKNGRIHHSKFPSAENVHGHKNYAFPQCKSCLHIANFHQPSVTLLGCSQDADGVTAVFDHGTSQRFDLLVGADGYRSMIRRQIIPDARAEYAGYILWRGNYPEAR